MKQRTRTSWILYWTGHLISRPMCWWNWAFLYRPYSKIMLASAIRDPEGRIWKKEN